MLEGLGFSLLQATARDFLDWCVRGSGEGGGLAGWVAGWVGGSRRGSCRVCGGDCDHDDDHQVPSSLVHGPGGRTNSSSRSQRGDLLLVMQQQQQPRAAVRGGPVCAVPAPLLVLPGAVSAAPPRSARAPALAACGRGPLPGAGPSAPRPPRLLLPTQPQDALRLIASARALGKASRKAGRLKGGSLGSQ